MKSTAFRAGQLTTVFKNLVSESRPYCGHKTPLMAEIWMGKSEDWKQECEVPGMDRDREEMPEERDRGEGGEGG